MTKARANAHLVQAYYVRIGLGAVVPTSAFSAALRYGFLIPRGDGDAADAKSGFWLGPDWAQNSHPTFLDITSSGCVRPRLGVYKRWFSPVTETYEFWPVKHTESVGPKQKKNRQSLVIRHRYL
jgi:hypothetical protein